MTEGMMENRVKKLKALESQIAGLQEQADAIKSELKADLEEKGVDELKTKNFIIRWKEIISSRCGNDRQLSGTLPGRETEGRGIFPDIRGRFRHQAKQHAQRDRPDTPGERTVHHADG